MSAIFLSRAFGGSILPHHRLARGCVLTSLAEPLEPRPADRFCAPRVEPEVAFLLPDINASLNEISLLSMS